jgi:hypothetical protein
MNKSNNVFSLGNYFTGNRMVSDVMTSKAKKIGWKRKRDIKNYIQELNNNWEWQLKLA